MFSIGCILLFAISSTNSLPTDGLSNYQLLNYIPSVFSFSQDEKVTPKCIEGDVAHIDFEAYQKKFKLRLQKFCQLIDEDEEVLSSGDSVFVEDVTNSVVYFQGYLEGQSNSTVEGTVENGVFQGVIITEDRQKYIVERLNPPINGAHSLIFQVHSRKQVTATLFSEGSGSLPTDVLLENSGDGSGSDN